MLRIFAGGTAAPPQPGPKASVSLDRVEVMKAIEAEEAMILLDLERRWGRNTINNR